MLGVSRRSASALARGAVARHRSLAPPVAAAVPSTFAEPVNVYFCLSLFRDCCLASLRSERLWFPLLVAVGSISVYVFFRVKHSSCLISCWFSGFPLFLNPTFVFNGGNWNDPPGAYAFFFFL